MRLIAFGFAASAMVLTACGGGNAANSVSPQNEVTALTFKQVQDSHQPSGPANPTVVADPFKAFLDAHKK